MATKNNFKFSTILKRSSCLNSLNESKVTDSSILYENLEALMKTTKNGREYGLQNSLRSYLESLCNCTNASKYYYQPISLIEQFNQIDKVVSEKILSEYTNRILPYVEDIGLVKYSVENSHMMDDQKSSILESVSNYQAGERVLANHNNLSKRFNMENCINKYKFGGVKVYAESVAGFLDTYSIKAYQKVNAAIDESCFLLEKNGIKYDSSEIAKYVTEYYLLREDYLTDKEKDNFTKALGLNIFTPSDIGRIIMDRPQDNTSIRNCVDIFISSQDKSPELLNQLMINALKSTTKDDVVWNIDKLLYLLWDIAKAKTFSDENVIESLSCVLGFLVNAANESINGSNEYTHLDLKSLIDKIQEVKNFIKIDCRSNSELSDIGVKFAEKFDNTLSNLADIKNIIYTDPNIKVLSIVNAPDPDAVPLKEFKIFKFHNLVKAAFNIDKFLSRKTKGVTQKARQFVKKVKNTLFESAIHDINIYQFIGEDNRAEICAAQYLIDESAPMEVVEEIHEFLSNVCSEFNDMMACENNTSLAYYVMNPGVAEIRIKEPTAIQLEDKDLVKVAEAKDNSLDVYFTKLSESVFNVNLIGSFDHRSILEQLDSISSHNDSHFTVDHFDAALEAMKYITDNKEFISEFTDVFSNYHQDALVTEAVSENKMISDDRLIRSIGERWTPEEDVPFDIQLEAYSLLESIFEDAGLIKESMADDWDDEDDDEDEKDNKDDEKKENNDQKKDDHKDQQPQKPQPQQQTQQNDDGARKKSGFNLHGLKLGLKGLAAKFKSMGSKSKEISRNLDSSVRNMVKGFKDSQDNERREQIIKGSVIPSFSKCIKTGILMAGSAIFDPTHIVAPAIIAIGGFAINHNLTRKEKILLLDEIETELDVVEKEINLADGENDMKKYRALLTYRKNLQRQYQRIRYNLRVGKDIVPGSNTGLKHPN